ncbi:hypothetical protein Micbo1qcDRAFT_192161 [Microdochium bolleyi]|uniref:MIT domain-containing protein n=1 Tax=Microdochium bolleyi TaxID=196109 RepID=A0A136JCX5_9PEZI|nr:hypothetical protein Micbo1qcDRAFT_192161 [Microdochium bolleyi]
MEDDRLSPAVPAHGSAATAAAAPPPHAAASIPPALHHQHQNHRHHHNRPEDTSAPRSRRHPHDPAGPASPRSAPSSPAHPPPTARLPALPPSQPAHRPRQAFGAPPLPSPSPLGASAPRQPVSSADPLARAASDADNHSPSSSAPASSSAYHAARGLRPGAISTPPVASQFHYRVNVHNAAPVTSTPRLQTTDYAAPDRLPTTQLGGDSLHDYSDSDDSDQGHDFLRQPRLIDLLPDDDDLFDDDDDYDDSYDTNHYSAPFAATLGAAAITRPFTATGIRGERPVLNQASLVTTNETSPAGNTTSSTARGTGRNLAPPAQSSRGLKDTLFTRFAPSSPASNDPPSPVPRLTRARTDTFGDRDPVSPNTAGFRNLNRWSASSAGTSYRPVTRDRDEDFPASLGAKAEAPPDRPPSVDSYTQVITHVEPAARTNSPRRLTKRRPSRGAPSSPSAKSSDPTKSLRQRRQSPPPNLPPLATLPPLDTTQSGFAGPTGAFFRNSPVVTTPNSVFAPQNGGGSDYFWDAIADRGTRNTSSKPTGTARIVALASANDQNMPGHTRNRSSNAKGSSDSGKTRDRSKPSQKAMLSKALGKANTAVQLDNAQNYEGAREAYVEACDLLHLVLARTTGEEDRKKLEAIRGTYTSRITELESLLPSRATEKRLPARPQSIERVESPDDMTAYDDPEDPVIIETATVLLREDAQANLPPPSGLAPSPIPSDSGRSANHTTLSPGGAPTNGPHSPLQSSFSIRRPFAGNTLAIPRGDVIPAPLSPRRTSSPYKPPSPEPIVRQDFSLPSDRLPADVYTKPSHTRNPSHESVSWLDPIDESGGSVCSSVHSRSSSLGIRRKHIRGASGDTEAEFDAALDAAVEAAYDDGYEPGDAASYNDTDPEDIVANAMRRVELAKERVRQTEREAGIESDRDWEKQPYMKFERDSMTFGELYNGSESEEEERMLDEMTREYTMGDFSFAPREQSQSGATRESNSSGVTSRTWNTSSMGSNAPTSTSVLSTVNENSQSATSSMSPPSLPPLGALPQIPSPQSKVAPASVRARRLSGQAAKQLKIETAKLSSPPQMPPPEMPASAMQAKSGGYIAQQRQNLSTSVGRAANFSLRTPSSPVRTASPAVDMGPPPTPPPPPPNFSTYEHDERADSPSFAMPNLRTNFSSSSLKSLRQRQASVTGHEESDLSPNTPLTTTLTNSSFTRQTSVPAVPPTPMGLGFGSKGGFGGMQLFESDFHLASPRSPQLSRSSKEQSDDIPLALEPCPSDVMLRPFWLMRALYQTLAHPRGGYITNRLFVPRDAWKVKGVKLRNIEDKCSQCDFLTAALSKLALVDSNDADAVLEEMQSLEGVLETVQQNLIKKLGNEVGTQGVSSLGGDKDGEQAPPVPRSASVSGKGGAFSWRRLRSKNSAANLTSAYGGKSSSGGSASSVPEHKEVTSGSVGGATLPSLPMVAQPTSRPAKRDVSSLKFDGPFAGYMASLARLFDAAQTVDQIARQVDDPGLRHADKTQVGLELCTRHAAEFFSFYICRFVLADLGMLLDKFVKRGSEWVLT